MAKNIMLAFVSPVSSHSLSNPINYPDVQGRPYTAIQTNESAIVSVERMLGENNSLTKIFLIASDSVKLDKAPPENEFGDVTHLEFLIRRVSKECPQLAKRFSIQDYSEEGTGSAKLETNILQTAQIADAVMTFASRYADEKIIVHADMTGGFRHTSMFMLSIIQLLKYRGVVIGEILYSEPTSRVIYRMTEIQRMFSLITGADEFVKFGSVEALNEYFGETPPPAVKKLLEAMNRFAEAIKICRTSEIENELKNLGRHIKTFREHPDKDLKSTLFAKIIDTIEREYGLLIGDSTNRLEIIRWCMRKGFWQQAMTLCTEWLPEELITRKICMPKNSSVIKNAELEGRSFGRNWQQQLIIAYQGADRFSDNTAAIKELCKSIRDVLENVSTSKLAETKSFGELKKFLAEYNAGKNSFELCAKGKMMASVFKKKFPCLAAGLHMIYDERRKNLIYNKNFYRFFQTLDYAKIPVIIATLSNEKLLALFKIDCEKIPAKNLEPAEKSESKWENRENVYRELFGKKIIRSDFNQEIALKFLRGYYDLRHERNQVNHANAYASKTISDLKPMIENFLDALEEMPADKKNAAALSRNG